MNNNIYTIAASLPFADTLAQWVLERYGDKPLHLPRVLILLPSRRAVLALREAFLRVSGGKSLLLPAMQPIGDVEDEALFLSQAVNMSAEDLLRMPPLAFALKRLFILARLIKQQRARVHGHSERLDRAIHLASELAHLLDEMEREQVSFNGLADLVPDTFAEHWQVTVEFLQLLSHHWPEIAREEGLISHEAWRNQRLMTIAHHWRKHPPHYPVIAAGTTGSIPATASLLATIANLPQGFIILPGLDTISDNTYFEYVTESHPQWGMQQLLAKLQCDRRHVRVIGEGNARIKLLAEVMRPAETSERWQFVSLDTRQAIEGLKLIVCAHAQEEATVIALMLREILETPNKTAALVTHDRALARRVAAIMKRFGVSIDDSAGMPLLQTPSAIFMRLILEVAASNAAPISLLSLLKHPFTQAGLTRLQCLEAARVMELHLLRGVHIPKGFSGLIAAAQHIAILPETVHQLLHNLAASFAALTTLFNSSHDVTLQALTNAHMACAQSLAGENFLQGQEGKKLSELIADSEQTSSVAGVMRCSEYLHVFEALLSGSVVRPEYGMHPRLHILGPLEARMQSFDRIILGGLNEDSWPPAPQDDPWFNRSMRRSLGLPVPERRTGLAAHDFYMLASAPEVMLTRAQKVDGVPTTPARWLSKLEALLDHFGVKDAIYDTRWNDWAAALDAVETPLPCKPPEPRPPLSARPRELSVTRIETWMRDPYAIYASHILCLIPLDPLERELDYSDFGSCIHQALERFVSAYPTALPANAYEKLLALGYETLSPLFLNASVKAWWWPRFMRIAAWFIQQEQLRRPTLAQVRAECKGAYHLDGFTLTGRADRIEYAKDGSLTIIDYKTGAPPLPRDIEAGLSSQLVLLALIANEEKFFPHPTLSQRERAFCLQYWQLRGGEEPGKIISLPEEKIAAYMQEAKEGLRRLIKTYNDPDFPYRASPIPARAGKYRDYDHLARVKEWG